MEIVTLGFPIYQIFKHKRTLRETHRALEDFDKKLLGASDGSTTTGSLYTGGETHSSLPSRVVSKRGPMHSMHSLDECLSRNHDDLQAYASCMELNGENIVFLTRVLEFRKTCIQAFQGNCKTSTDFQKARTAMFRMALSIFISLIHARTASYPINIESVIYARLDSIFGPATTLVAREKKLGSTSIATRTSSDITPWDEPRGEGDECGKGSYPMHPVGRNTPPPPHPTFSRKGQDSESQEHIIQVTMAFNLDGSIDPGGVGGPDPLQGVKVPAEFDETVFDGAFQSVRYMVWTETWQRYMNRKGKLGGARSRVSVREIQV